MDSKEVLLFITFLQLISLEEGFGNMKQDFYTCDRIRNVTIVPFIKEDDNYGKIIALMAYLIKSLLDTPCTTVWVYTPLENQAIPQETGSSNNFLETKIQAMWHLFDTNVIINFLTDVQELADEENQQTILLINDFINEITDLETIQIISDKLKKMDSIKHINVVLWCFYYDSICYHCKDKIRMEKTTYWINNDAFNAHIHKVLIDVILNEDYDRFNEYDDLDCRNETRGLHLWFSLLLSPGWSYSNSKQNYFYYMWRFFYIKFDSKYDRVANVNTGFESNEEFYQSKLDKILKSRYESTKAKGDNNINIVVKNKDDNFQIPKEMQHLSEWIIVEVDDSIHDSPRLEKDGIVTLWKQDLVSPLFFHMLIDKFKQLIC